MAERESINWFVFGKIRKLEMCVSDCIHKITVSSQDFSSWCHEMILVRTNKSTFCLIVFFFVSSLRNIIFIFASFVVEMRILAEMKTQIVKKIFSVGKKLISILFSSMKIKMMDL